MSEIRTFTVPGAGTSMQLRSSGIPNGRNAGTLYDQGHPRKGVVYLPVSGVPDVLPDVHNESGNRAPSTWDTTQITKKRKQIK